MSEATTYCATGRRKTSVARVWITPGTGRITINNRPFEEYVPTVTLQNSLLEHREILRALLKRDESAAESAMQKHLANGLEAVR